MAAKKNPEKLIMIVDDDEDLGFLLASQLEQAGYNVRKYLGGKDLVADVLKYKPALLLLDIAMQLVDGSDLCREIKGDAALKEVKVIMMSGNHEVAEHASACGGDGYIAKPLSLSAIKATVAKYV